MDFVSLVRRAKRILDIGCGPNGSYWYSDVPEDTSLSTIDLYFFPHQGKENLHTYKLDAVDLDRFDRERKIAEIVGGKERRVKVDWAKAFDLVVADHVFEHVSEPERLAAGISSVAKPGAYLHVSIPDPLNFTDRFYHLIHQDEGGGGHVSQIEKPHMIALMEDNGFELVEFKDIPDDWLWLKNLFDWRSRGIRYISQEDIDFIADTFLRELTPEKGYFYGGEYLFKKIK